MEEGGGKGQLEPVCSVDNSLLTQCSKHSKARRQYLRLATSGDGMGVRGVSYVNDSDSQVLLGSGMVSYCTEE